MELRVSGPVNALPIRNADVRTEIDGIIEAVHVDEGQEVAKDPADRPDYDRDVRAELGRAEA
jgi:hypothetical protein